MCPSDFSDELFESMASAVEGIPASSQLRDSVLSRTTGIIRTRRRVRRVGMIAALIGCYLGGVATVSLWPGSREMGRVVAESATGNDESKENAAVQKLVQPEDDQVVTDEAQPTTVQVTPYDRLRRAGDRQLERYADIPRATRSYERALQIASAEQRRIAPDRDTWLLMALKQSSNNN
jgi:hypothetical protein